MKYFTLAALVGAASADCATRTGFESCIKY